MGNIKNLCINKALVVEDDLWFQPIISAVIRSTIPGITIDWVESAEEGARKTQLNRYQIIVADIQLKPNQNTGIDFWYFCKDECPEVPILLTSSMSVDHFLDKMGIYGPPYIAKPFNPFQFKEVIKNLVSWNCPTS